MSHRMYQLWICYGVSRMNIMFKSSRAISKYVCQPYKSQYLRSQMQRKRSDLHALKSISKLSVMDLLTMTARNSPQVALGSCQSIVASLKRARSNSLSFFSFTNRWLIAPTVLNGISQRVKVILKYRTTPISSVVGSLSVCIQQLQPYLLLLLEI